VRVGEEVVFPVAVVQRLDRLVVGAEQEAARDGRQGFGCHDPVEQVAFVGFVDVDESDERRSGCVCYGDYWL
jgi:hypothetical protein